MRKPSKHCLLVVDDEPDLVHSVKDLLRYEYRVLGATRAVEGLKIMEKEEVHIVMSDQRMPEMTGVEFLAELRNRNPDTVRLLFTGYADIDAVISAINQGSVYRYITKPWEPHELQTVLRQAAEHYDLLRERNRLLEELKQKNQQLRSANAELQQSNELKRAFIKVASHELRTPLTIVLGMAELAKHAKSTEPPLSNWIERIHVGSQRLNDRVEQMIKLLLADKYDKPLLRTDVDVAEVLHAAAGEVQSFIDQRKQTLHVDIAANLGTIHAERDKIRDCIEQLLINAVKFTPDEGTIRLEASGVNGNGIEISVIDTGMGIDKESLPRIFDPFFTRFDVSRHSSGVYEFDRRGLGLGLSVVKAFTEMHGGEVTVDSRMGEGSKFTIRLPRSTSNDHGGSGPA